MENIIVAVSNLPALYPIYVSFIHQDYITTACIVFVALASFASHLFENHKHDMPGLGLSEQASYCLNRMDVLGCALVGSRFFYKYYYKYGFNLDVVVQNKVSIVSCLLPFIFLFISEYDKYNAKLKNKYIITHCIWHVSIFMTMGFVLNKFFY